MKTILLLTAAIFVGDAYAAARPAPSHQANPAQVIHAIIGTGYPAAGQHDYLQHVLDGLIKEIKTFENVCDLFREVQIAYNQMSGEAAKRLGRVVGKITGGVDSGDNIAAHVKVMAILRTIIKVSKHYDPNLKAGDAIHNRLVDAEKTINERFFVSPDETHRYLTTQKIHPYDVATGEFKEKFLDSKTNREVEIPSHWYRQERLKYIHAIKSSSDLPAGSFGVNNSRAALRSF